MNIALSPDRTSLTLNLPDDDLRIHAVWLRDNALDAATKSPDNGQRLITLLDQPENPEIELAEIEADNLRVAFSGDQAQYLYPLHWLQQHRYDRAQKNDKGWTSPAITRWGDELQDSIPTVTYEDARNDSATLADWLEGIRCYGFAVMNQLPEKPDALLDAVDLFGFVRETNYGRFFEVRSEINPVNLAYTSKGLQAHTDNPYRDPVPTLQILACLENTAEGGESIVVDGFKVAQTLKEENGEHFDLLSRYCARFEYAGSDDTSLSSKRPMIELSPDGELIAVRFNNRSAAPFTDIPFDEMPAYYAAYRHFAEIVERNENEVAFKLEANQLFIVDNTRVMHSRNAFSGSGSRWLRGCYADKDGLLSTLAVLRKEK